MNLKDVYSKVDLRKLVAVLESQQDYTSECIRVVKKEFESRKTIPDSITKIATEEYIVKLVRALSDFDPLKDKFIVPESYFLDRNTSLELAKIEFNKWIKKKQDYGFDVLKYSIGGL